MKFDYKLFLNYFISMYQVTTTTNKLCKQNITISGSQLSTYVIKRNRNKHTHTCYKNLMSPPCVDYICVSVDMK